MPGSSDEIEGTATLYKEEPSLPVDCAGAPEPLLPDILYRCSHCGFPNKVGKPSCKLCGSTNWFLQ